MSEGRDWLAQLGSSRSVLDRGSTAERVADVLRDHLTDGLFPPGARLVEEALCEALGVSRNTLREAFRVLSHEGLVSYEFNRGVFVQTLSTDDVRDLFKLRRIIELAAVRTLGTDGSPALDRAGSALNRAEQAAADGRWGQVGTENLHFHQALVETIGSRRVSDTTRRLLAELRLAFHAMVEPASFHQPYLVRNRRIYELLRAGHIGRAAGDLAQYLDDAEQQLLTAIGEIQR